MSPLLEANSSSKNRSLSVLLPEDMVRALKTHFRTKTGLPNYIAYLVKQDLDVNGYTIFDGSIMSKEEVEILKSVPIEIVEFVRESSPVLNDLDEFNGAEKPFKPGKK